MVTPIFGATGHDGPATGHEEANLRHRRRSGPASRQPEEPGGNCTNYIDEVEISSAEQAQSKPSDEALTYTPHGVEQR